LSIQTARRLCREGKVKVTRLSEKRVGIRSDHDREFLDRCIEGGA
jgi:hypothetical protein